MRRLVAALLVLAGLAVGADRLAAWAAERAVADRLAAAEHLPVRPTVGVAGFPFLTQVAGGVYRQVTVTARDVPAGPVRLATLTARLFGVHLPPGALLRGRLPALPVDRLQATARLGLGGLAAAFPARGLHLQVVGGRLRVSRALAVAGQTVRASALAEVSLHGDRLALTAGPPTVDAAGIVAVLPGTLSVSVVVGRLPFGLRLTGVRVVPGGLLLSAVAVHAVVPG